MTATNDSAFNAKHQPVPTTTMVTPAKAGPMMRATWKSALLSPIAFGRSAGPVISDTNARRAGLSIDWAMPWRSTIVNTIQSATTPMSVSTASTPAVTPIVIAVSTRIIRLSKRSASTPAHAPSRSVGTNCKAIAAPMASPLLCDRCSTSQPSAIVCIHVPQSEMPWPTKNNR